MKRIACISFRPQEPYSRREPSHTGRLIGCHLSRYMRLIQSLLCPRCRNPILHGYPILTGEIPGGCIVRARSVDVNTLGERVSTGTSTHTMGTPTEFEFFDGGAESVCIAGSWTEWSPESMARDGANGERWTYSAALTPGTNVEFKFVVDGNWVFASHYDNTDDGHGARNNARCVPLPAPDAPDAPDLLEDDPKAAAKAKAADVPEGPDATKQASRDCSEMSSVSPDGGLSGQMGKLAVSGSQESEGTVGESDAAAGGKPEKAAAALAGSADGEDFDVHDSSDLEEEAAVGSRGSKGVKLEGGAAGNAADGKMQTQESAGGCVIM